jgi:uncharacterized protein
VTLGKRCIVAYATPEAQYLWHVELPAAASIADALAAARRQAPQAEVPWDEAPVGIFGERRARTDVPAEGDRIEIYRPLAHDPREARRARVKQSRRAGRC